MKKTLSAALLALLAGSLPRPAAAQADAVAAAIVRATGAESIVADRTTVVDVALNPKTVKCSAADYQAPMLKVLVPGLAELTVLNHRNTREGAPCIAAGRCGDELGPDSILKDGAGTDAVPVRVTLKKIAAIEGDLCKVTLVETVDATIRGVPFHHQRAQAVADRNAADCR